MGLLPLERMNQRITTDRSDSDSALFNSLLLKGELIAKLTTAGFVAVVQEDTDRHKYTHLHQLVRADGLGGWTDVLDALLIGPSSQLLPQNARAAHVQLTKNEAVESWQHRAVELLNECLRCIDPTTPQLGNRIQGRQWFRDFATLRNRTRGHGAARPSTLSDACPSLEESLGLMEKNLGILNQPWAYIRQNLSGKYRVTYWMATSDAFEELKRTEDKRLPEGVYVDLGDLHQVELIESDADASDVWLVNGKFTEKNHELLSYFTDNTKKRDSSPYLQPVQPLPPSETEGLGRLDLSGNTFTNLPPVPSGYVPRRDLESQLREQLCITDRHSVVTLTGYGGIGKTSLALAVINDLMERDSCPYDVAIWFSARDVDLLTDGPKLVRTKGVTIRDFAAEYIKLTEPSMVESGDKKTRVEDYLATQMGVDSEHTGLFVFDNFETTSSPLELYQWIDTYVRPPNKVLITSRERRFTGDYAVQVNGMNRDECYSLIDSVAALRGMGKVLNENYKTQIIDESRGHPYVIKLILGELVRNKHQRKVERIIADQDRVLDALFERSYNRLAPAAQRAFLTLCNWKSSVPRVALEAVLIRPKNEIMNVDSAIDELLDLSFIEEFGRDTSESDVWLTVPLSARVFGNKKLRVSPSSVAIKADSEFLQLFGAVNQRNNLQRVEPRVHRMFAEAARRIEKRHIELDDVVPILEYVSGKFSVGWIFMAELLEEFGEPNDQGQILEYLMKYVENPNSQSYPASQVWRRIAMIHEAFGGLNEALDALVQVTRQPDASVDELSDIANQINGLLRKNAINPSWDKYVKDALIQDAANEMENNLENLNADDCSRLAWLYMNIGDKYNARRVASLGLDREYDNQHCERLIERLEGNWRC